MLSSPDASITIFEKEKRYARILNNLPLPAGDYTKLIVHLKGCSREDEAGSSSKSSKISNQTTRTERKGRHGYYHNHYHHHRHNHPVPYK